MLVHYFSFAIRSLGRNRSTSAVGGASLALGMFCLLAAYVFVDYLRSGERSFPKSERIYSVYQAVDFHSFGVSLPLSPISSTALAGALAIDFPELEAVARADIASAAAVSVDGVGKRVRLGSADPAFLDIFELPFVARTASNPLAEPAGAVINESAALALFGTADALGRTIRLHHGLDVTVTGITADIRGPSHLGQSFLWDGFEVLVPWEALRGDAAADGSAAWTGLGAFTYVLLPEDGSLTAHRLNDALAGLGERHIAPVVAVAQFEARHVSRLLVDFYQAIFAGDGLGGISVIHLLLMLGGLALAIGCVNFVNLSTATAMRRTKEIGMRKTLGATPVRIARQHLVEVFCVAAVALAVALAGVAACRALLALRWGVDIPLPFGRPAAVAFVVGVLLAVSMIAAAYPAIVLSGVRPTSALRASGGRAGSRGLRLALITGQLAAASLLLIAVAAMQQQNTALRASNTVFTLDPLVTTSSPAEGGIDFATFEAELRRSPAIRAVTATDVAPWSISFGGGSLRPSPEPSSTPVLVQNRFVGHDYFQTLGITPIAGRVFSRNRSSDLSALTGEDSAARVTAARVVIDRRTSLALGWRNAADAVGKLVYGGADNDVPAEIIGVVDDKPMTLVALSNTFVYRLAPESATIPLIRISRDDVADALAHIDMVWQTLAPGYAPTREFVDETFEGAYALFEGAHRIFLALAVFAVVIAATGVFSVAAEVSNRRRREIGIRKVQGATSAQALGLLLRDFSAPVIAAQVIAWPIGYLATRAYLDLFIERIELGAMPFLSSFAVTLLIAFAAVAAPALSAARQNPARVLRCE
jgi:putative ABC transport system permease protein